MNKLEKLSTLIPLEQLEQSAQQQIYNALDLEFLKKLAIMPDCHTGYTLPIGGVALLDDVISPEYVGYDIGCGMCCIVTDVLVKEMLPNKKQKVKIFNEIYEKIPVGFNSRDKGLDYEEFKSASGDKDLNKKVNDKLHVQIGTLGSGNHFIEIGENQKEMATVTIHSGSRNMGHSVASYYMTKSKQVDKDLPNGFLSLDGDEGTQYLQDMDFCLGLALQNRKAMMVDVLDILGFKVSKITTFLKSMINENHNHAILRKDGVLHRKGATPAELDTLGVIPGTMKSGVYITKGLGNEEYLSSASHGAGRKMSRKKAKLSISLERHKEVMKGIVGKVNKSTLDESHDAYKDLNKVVMMQEGVVIETIDFVKPLINIKG